MVAGDVKIVGGGTDLLAKLIYWASSTASERCVYSHTELAVGERVNDINASVTSLLFGAEAVVKLRQQDAPRRYKLYGWATPTLQRIAADVADELVGELDDKYYGLQQFLFFGWRKLCNMLKLPARWAIHQWFNGDYICTTVVNIHIRRVAERGGFPVSYPYGDGALTPLDVVHICDQLVHDGHMVLREEK